MSPRPRLPRLLREIADHAVRTPDAPALFASDGSLTYAELDARVRGIARGLVEHGVAPGDRVAFIGHKTTTSVAALLGIMRAGAAYIPLDPRAPLTRLVHLVADASCPVVLTSAGHDATFAQQVTADTTTVPVNATTLHGSESAALPERIDDDAVALCLYTSGSTGHPKAAQLTHRSVEAFLNGYSQLDGARVTAGARCLNVAAFHFDASLSDLLLPLRSGAVVHLGPPLPVPEAVLGIVAAERITHMSAVGSTMTLLADHSDDFAGHDISSLRGVFSGAEILNPRTIQRWLAKAPDLTVINSFGPTETTCAVICHPIGEREPGRTEHYPIGKPLQGTTIRFRDEDGTLSEDGPGEILIAGPQVMKGYLNRPEEEARAFLIADGITFYRTGDWGSRQPDGVILFDGRRDDEVKVRGHRVNLNEVTRTLELHSEVGRAFAVALHDEEHGTVLACAVTPPRADRHSADDTTATRLSPLSGDLERILRKHLAEQLPAHMIPETFHALPGLPVLSSGKPDTSLVRTWLGNTRTREAR